MKFDLLKRTCLLTIGGSRAYGMAISTSDVDVKGIAIAPSFYDLGFLHRFEQADKPEHMKVFYNYMSADEKLVIDNSKLEGVVFNIKKFFTLAADCNPNILDILFCRDEEVRVQTEAGKILRENANLFISSRAKFTFSGYAISQLKRIKTHRRWLLNPPDHKPTRAEFDLPENTLIPSEQLEAAWSMIQKKMDSWQFDFDRLSESDRIHIMGQIEETLSEIGATADNRWLSASRAVGLDSNFILLLDRERRYKAAMTEYQQYENWKASRNEARSALESEYGYDTKHAAHLVRLLKMGKEILTTGKVNVHRGGIDSDELIGIRKGAWTYDQLIEWAEKSDEELNKIYKSNSYVIPKEPNREKLDRLCINLVQSYNTPGQEVEY